MSNLITVQTFTPKEEQFYKDYKLQNPKLFKNKIIDHFFLNPNHAYLLGKYLIRPTSENGELLEHKFRQFFFCIRFTKYLSSLIRFCDIDFHRKRRRHEERSPLVFDVPLGEDEDRTLGDSLYSQSFHRQSEAPLKEPELFQWTLENEYLFAAFNELTERQKLVITLAYSTYALDTEIADYIQISQQAVTKIRILALNKMRNYLLSPGISHQRSKKEARRRAESCKILRSSH
ncbi:hypothetical protein GK047_18135 [Paenibacillus sp. SYP-B3998]|uniref:Sigma-70 family RNA polymerase sigma factor n=1 Tax=Paenibacillus sp. SYP-B3998 TaxID=2678564 RepID=A0A6G4A0K4_9BACL|nr:hypothetical protein [Paenibacillus sp. SYP-B3998]NEW07922.1 hypothetical protein [Paenibacillus sp. SYP-B3998]